MDPVYWGTLGFLALLIFIAVGVPVAIALSVIGTVGLFGLMGVPGTFKLLALQFFSFICTFEFSAIPLFLIMGYVAFHTGLTGAAFNSARLWLSRLPGGLAIATVTACGMFGACCGSGIPACAAMGKIAIPEMLKYKYDKKLAAGCVSSAATLAVLIPPSIVMVIYAVFVECSLGKLLMAGYLPGALSVLIFSIMIVVRVRLNPHLAPPVPGEVITWKKRLISLKDIWGILLLALLVMGTLYTGFFTATEAAAAGAFGAFLLMFITKTFQWEKIKDAMSETLLVGGMTFLVILGALLYSRFIALTGLPKEVANLIVSADISIYWIVVLLALLYIFLGCFMDSISMLLVTMPVILPALNTLKVDLIWFGIIFVKLVEIGAITPPFGISVYALSGVVAKDIPITDIFRGIWWFLLMEFLTLAILIAFPEISLFLPRTMMGQ